MYYVADDQGSHGVGLEVGKPKDIDCLRQSNWIEDTLLVGPSCLVLT